MSKEKDLAIINSDESSDESLISSLKKEVSKLKKELRKQEAAFNKCEAERMEFGRRCQQYELDAIATSRASTALEYNEIKGDCAVLWITGPKSLITASSFANIRNRIEYLCPNIDLIVATTNEIKVMELSDEMLNRVGLARIVETKNIGEGEK
jgi:hypothetical protein